MTDDVVNQVLKCHDEQSRIWTTPCYISKPCDPQKEALGGRTSGGQTPCRLGRGLQNSRPGKWNIDKKMGIEISEPALLSIHD
jgi:hypothetical protein